MGRFTESDGRVLDPPRALEEGLARLRKEQRALSRKFEALKAAQTAENRAAKAEGREARRLPRSNRLKRQIAEVGRAHTRVTNVRDHWHKLNARRVADAYDRVAYEKHGLTFMTRNRRLARVASDRALGAQEHALASANIAELIAFSPCEARTRSSLAHRAQTRQVPPVAKVLDLPLNDTLGRVSGALPGVHDDHASGLSLYNAERVGKGYPGLTSLHDLFRQTGETVTQLVGVHLVPAQPLGHQGGRENGQGYREYMVLQHGG